MEIDIADKMMGPGGDAAGGELRGDDGRHDFQGLISQEEEKGRQGRPVTHPQAGVYVAAAEGKQDENDGLRRGEKPCRRKRPPE